ncbi:MAG: creatininase family protein [Eubacteriales bacterium]|nr:creatininase family protein [Eubacteriales bacterium]
MRTRFLPKMTHDEVVEYRKRNDIIFVPFGTVEVHGTFPLDVEQVTPEAFALCMAEKVDGLVLGQLPYFYPGASPISPGTVQMSVEAGITYLKNIAHSLLNQGFRRQIYLSFHGPAFLTAGTVVVDFFDETKVPIAYIDLVQATQYAKTQGTKIDMYDSLFYGAYEILDRKNELVVDPEIDAKPKEKSETGIDYFEHFRRYAHPSGAVGFYFAKPEDHAGMTGACKSIEQRDFFCKKGANMIREIVNCMDMPGYVDAMRKIDQETSEIIIPRYEKILPGGRK